MELNSCTAAGKLVSYDWPLEIPYAYEAMDDQSTTILSIAVLPQESIATQPRKDGELTISITYIKVRHSSLITPV